MGRCMFGDDVETRPPDGPPVVDGREEKALAYSLCARVSPSWPAVAGAGVGALEVGTGTLGGGGAVVVVTGAEVG